MKSLHVLYIAFLILFIGGAIPALSGEKEEKKETAVKATEKQKTTLIELFSWATDLPKALIDLQAQLDRDQGVLKIEKQLPNLAKSAEELQWDSKLTRIKPDVQLLEITNYQTRAHRLSAKLNSLQKTISASIADLSVKRREWQEKKVQIETFAAEEIHEFALAKEQLQSVKKTSDIAFKLIEERLSLALVLGKKVSDIQINLYVIESNLKDLAEEKIAASIYQTSPSMLSAEFYSRLNYNTLQHGSSNIKHFLKEQSDVFKEKKRFVFFGLVVFAGIAYGLRKTKALTPASSYWYPFASCYLATTVFLAATLYGICSQFGISMELPKHYPSFAYILMLLAVIRLTRHLVHFRWRRGVFIPLTIFMVLIIGMTVVDLPQVLILLYVFYVSLVALLFYVCQLPGTRGRPVKETWLRRGVGIFPAVVVVSGVFGYDQFAVIIFSTTLMAITASLSIWIMYELFLGILDLLLLFLPFALVNENREKIVARVQPVVASLHILLFVAIQAVIWDRYGTAGEALEVLFSKGFAVGGLNITLGFILTVIFVFYSTVLVSKGFRALLLAKVLPRYGAEKGVQLSIARLVHYAVLTVGFFVVLRVLGFELSQLTLLGGALGVGIGFGLQAIVNNIASGLILLFERPIKVGDTIQIGNELGEVRNMGLRATIIQTFDNAEIVVPNSDLITGQVTNWTLAERKIRLRIPVGVAYGSEVDKVLQILLGCANSNPMVLNTPAPIPFFMAFGASSLDFELRVWIPEFLDKTQVLSDLNQDIENEFAINGIEVPFPQTDLHLRSVDSTAAERLRGTAD